LGTTKKVTVSRFKRSPDAFSSTLKQAEKYKQSDWKKGIQETSTFIAVKDGVDQGLVRCAEDRSDPSSLFLISMWVAPNARRNGLSEKLIVAAVGWAQQRGIDQLFLDVADENFSAIALYDKWKFEPNGVIGTLPKPSEYITEHRRVRKL